MRVGELAQLSGVTAQTVRFYERSGLLRPAERTHSGYRVYGPGDLKRIRFIRKAKQLGFSLDEIRELLHRHDAGQTPCHEVIRIAEGHLHNVAAEIRRLQRFRTELARALQSWKKIKLKHVAGDEICELIERAVSDKDVIFRVNGDHTRPSRIPGNRVIP